LAKTEILREIEYGNIVIDPFDPEMVGPASVDLRLSNVFRVFKTVRRNMAINDLSDFKNATERVVVSDFLLLIPGETALGITMERIKLSENICGWLEGRSRFARFGLLVHISASFMQPGIDNHQVLELSNFGPQPLELYPGTRICQFIFERAEGKGKYKGTFQLQTPETF
jgi:dCTP deaminase